MSDMYVCTKSSLKKKQIPRVFSHTWQIKLILILNFVNVVQGTLQLSWNPVRLSNSWFILV